MTKGEFWKREAFQNTDKLPQGAALLYWFQGSGNLCLGPGRRTSKQDIYVRPCAQRRCVSGHVWRLLLCSQRLLSVTCFANSKTSMCGSVGSAGNGELRMIQGVLCCEACEQRHQSEWLRTSQKLRFSQYCQRPCCAELRAASGAHATSGLWWPAYSTSGGSSGCAVCARLDQCCGSVLCVRLRAAGAAGGGASSCCSSTEDAISVARAAVCLVRAAKRHCACRCFRRVVLAGLI